MQTSVSDSATTLAILTTGLEPSYPVIIFGVAVTFIWGFVWSGFMRDEEQQPLPSSFAAKLFFALSLCVIYIALVVGGFAAPEILRNFQLPGLSDLPESLIRQIPLFAIILMGAVSSFPQIKQVAQRYAILLHNAQYRHNDEIVLQRHLESCNYIPTSDELSANIDYIRQFDVYITDRDSASLNLEAVGAWRKVSSLLRMLDEECRSRQSILSAAERESVVRLQEAHRRKTQLAMNIVRMIEHIDANSNVDQTVKQVATQLGEVSHRDRESVGASEETVRQIVNRLDFGPMPGKTQAPLRLSMKQMNEYLNKIERYFLAEYQIILQETARLAAKIVVRSGDEAAERLARVKAIGFISLGNIQRVNFDNVIWVLVTSFLLAFGGLTLLFTILGRPVNTSLVSSIALTVSLAALVGAMWGSRRSLVERQGIPWASYITAGLVGVAAFCIVHGTRFLVDSRELLGALANRLSDDMPKYVSMNIISPEAAQYFSRELILDWTLLNYLWEILPWATSVLFLTVGICWLARVPEWSWAKGNATYERITDGVFTGLIYAAGGVASTLAHIALKTGSGIGATARIIDGTDSAFTLFFGSFRMISFVIGFAIGAIIIREVRQIAHTQLIDRSSAAHGPRAGVSQSPADEPQGVPGASKATNVPATILSRIE